MNDDNIVHLIHTVWSAALTVFGGIVVWNWNRLVKEVDSKADKSEVTQLREDLQNRWDQQDKLNRSRDEQQERQHRENRSRLDTVLTMLANGRRQS